MLKINERLDKLAAARADFTARGMLAESCLVQAIRDTFSGEDVMDEDTDDSDESDDPTSDEIDVLDHDRPLDDMDTHTLHNANTHAPGPIDNDHTDNNHPHPNQDSSTLPNDEEDDDHGPVESGPLMNEVRLASKKG